jgi:hypothetical protein
MSAIRALWEVERTLSRLRSTNLIHECTTQPTLTPPTSAPRNRARHSAGSRSRLKLGGAVGLTRRHEGGAVAGACDHALPERMKAELY